MDAKKVLQVIVLLDAILTRGPALMAALKGVVSAESESELQAQLAALREANDDDYQAAMAALDRVANS